MIAKTPFRHHDYDLVISGTGIYKSGLSWYDAEKDYRGVK